MGAPSLFVRFRRLRQTQLFKYGLAAGSATIVDVGLFTLLSTFVFTSAAVRFEALDVAIKGTNIALLISFTCGVLTHFVISSTYVFPGSTIRRRYQLARFAGVNLLVFFGNYGAVQGLYGIIPQLVELPESWLNFFVRGTAAVVVGLVSFSLHRVISFPGHGTKAVSEPSEPEV